jgi:cell division protease FtsH
MSGAFTKAWLEQHRVDTRALGPVEIIGIGHVTRELHAIAARLTEPDRARAMGLEPPRGVLIWGAPGLGKTLSARYLARLLGADVPFYEVGTDELTPERLRGTVRHLAAAGGLSVVFLDEIDGFALHRDNWAHDPASRGLLSASLSLLDGLTPRRGPLLVASSNRPPTLLDPALMRPGRFDLHVAVRHPDEAERLALLRFFARDLPMDDRVDLERVAALARRATPADLKGVLSDAASIAFANGRSDIDDAAVQAAAERSGRVWPEVEDEALSAPYRRRAAIHEAGHVVVAAVLYGVDEVHSVRIGRHGGETVIGEEERDVTTEGELINDLIITFAGLAAERAILGDASAGSQHDMRAATEIAIRRIESGLGQLALPIDINQLDPVLPPRLVAAFGRDLEAQFTAVRGRAEELVAEHAAVIERFAVQLADIGELDGDALRDALAEAGFTRPEAVAA